MDRRRTGCGGEVLFHLAEEVEEHRLMTAPPHRPLNIVIVDDDEIDVMNVKRAFEKANICSDVFVASDGVEGLELLRSGSVPAQRRMVLLDINMPRMNGIEFLKELRADPQLSPTPVVVFSTSNDERDLAEAYRHHVAGYMLKPVSFESVIELMRAVERYWSFVELV
jgi:CheY-like chemotaxis protein